ncbi:hypothetical protein B1J93_08620 [Leptospira kirschneri serovar Pomona]|uniref:Uncharacterized protein n=2 Tax=Leptospira TaxID=171 RepID=A0A1T1DQX6_9LEPT|nr:hypothetical protein LEP1GSC186_3238 [Leptospira noguchii serovar Autumnalis str. ZUN142]OOV43033.1 hypothetical protein B1J93_08620 [Leptospira kirschneri serovar Pomona]
MIIFKFFKFIFSARVTSIVLFKKKKFSLIFRNYFSLGLIGFPIFSFKVEKQFQSRFKSCSIALFGLEVVIYIF